MGTYGTRWRILRKLCSSELLVIKRMDEMAPLRQKCIDKMIRWIEDEATTARAQGGEGEVEVSNLVFCMGFNLIANLTLSRDFFGKKPEEGNEFCDAIGKILETVAKPNMADFFPFFKWLDPQGIKRNMERELRPALDMIARFVKERVEERQTSKGMEKRDFVDVLLEYKRGGKQGCEELSDKNMNIIILVICCFNSFCILNEAEFNLIFEYLHDRCRKCSPEEPKLRAVRSNGRCRSCSTIPSP